MVDIFLYTVAGCFIARGNAFSMKFFLVLKYFIQFLNRRG
jgi:hypothetical protein